MLARLVPELARLTGTPAAAGDPSADRYLLQSAAAELLGRLEPAAAAAARRRRPPLGRRRDAAPAPPARARRRPEARLLVARGLPRPRRGDRARARGHARRPRRASTASTRLSLGRLSDEEVGAFIRASTDAEAPGELAVGDRRAHRRHAAAALRALARPARERRRRGVGRRRAARRGRSPSCAAPSGSATSCGSASRASPPRRPRRSSSPPSPGRGSSCASSPRPPGSTAARSPPPSSEAIRDGLVEELPEPAPAVPLHARARPPRRLRPDHRHPPRRAAPPRRRGARARPRGRPGPRPARARPPLHARRARRGRRARRRLQPARGRRGDRGRGLRRGAPRGSRRALELGIADPRERARVQVELALPPQRDGPDRRRPRRCWPRASTPRPASRSEASRRARSSSASAHRLGDPGARSRRDAERSRRRAIETFEQLGDARGLADGRAVARHRAHAPGPRGRGLRRARARARARRGLRRPGHAPAGRRDALRTSLCHGPTPVAEAIRRCEELLRVEPATTACSRRSIDALPRRAPARWPAASTRRASTSGRAASSSTSSNQRPPSWVYRWAAARGEGARRRPRRRRAGARRRAWQRFRDVGDDAIDERAMQRRLPARAPLLRRRPLGRRRASASPTAATCPLPSPPARAVLRLAVEARLAAHRGRLAEALALARRAVELAERDRHPEPQGPRLAGARRGAARGGATAEADAAVAEALRLYEAKGNVAAAASAAGARRRRPILRQLPEAPFAGATAGAARTKWRARGGGRRRLPPAAVARARRTTTATPALPARDARATSRSSSGLYGSRWARGAVAPGGCVQM